MCFSRNTIEKRAAANFGHCFFSHSGVHMLGQYLGHCRVNTWATCIDPLVSIYIYMFCIYAVGSTIGPHLGFVGSITGPPCPFLCKTVCFSLQGE